VKSLSSYIVILLMVSVASWRLVYAFVEKEECSKEEKTFG
jgi:hypothetical protein